MADSAVDHEIEANWLEGGEADGEEEPLFADDLTDEEDDPPPLPPPMPTLGELTAGGQRGHSGSSNGVSSGGGIGAVGGAGDGAPAGQGTGANDQEPPQKKRKPLLTLKVERIFSENGLSYVEREFPKLKFRGKGHEASDLKYLMQQYEHWANILYPKMTFKDLTDRVEALASKKDFKSQLLMMRRRAARGGRATPPLNSDDSDHEGEGRAAVSQDLNPPVAGSNSDNGTPGMENGLGGDGSSNGEHLEFGSANHIQNSETAIVDGARGEGMNGDSVGGVNHSSNTALNRLTLDGYGSSDED